MIFMIEGDIEVQFTIAIFPSDKYFKKLATVCRIWNQVMNSNRPHVKYLTILSAEVADVKIANPDMANSICSLKFDSTQDLTGFNSHSVE